MENKNRRQQNTLTGLLGELTEERTSGLAFSLATIVPYVLVPVFAIVCAVAGLMRDGVEQEDWYLYFSYLLPQLAFALVAVAYFKLTKNPIKTMLGKPKLMDFLLAIGLQFGLLSLGLLNGWFIEWLNGLGFTVTEPTIPSVDGFGLVGVLFVIAVLPAVFEEVLFRGILLKGLKGFPVWAAALLCGGMFSLFHQNPAQTLYQFFCGVAFALIAIRSGSILPTALAHFLNNALIILSAKFSWNVYVLPILIDSAVCLVLSLAYLIVGFMKEKNEGAPTQTESDAKIESAKKTERKQFFLYAAAGLAICVIGWISGLFGG